MGTCTYEYTPQDIKYDPITWKTAQEIGKPPKTLRPIVQVRFSPPKEDPFEASMLLDTGADSSYLHIRYMARFGIRPGDCKGPFPEYGWWGKYEIYLPPRKIGYMLLTQDGKDFDKVSDALVFIDPVNDTQKWQYEGLLGGCSFFDKFIVQFDKADPTFTVSV